MTDALHLVCRRYSAIHSLDLSKLRLNTEYLRRYKGAPDGLFAAAIRCQAPIALTCVGSSGRALAEAVDSAKTFESFAHGKLTTCNIAGEYWIARRAYVTCGDNISFFRARHFHFFGA
jgi:hypothetical protein